MRIFIIDNGRSYSDHRIYFVSTVLPLPRMKRLVRLLNLDEEGQPPGEHAEVYTLVAEGELNSFGGLDTTGVHGLIRDAFNGWGCPQEDDVKAIEVEEAALLRSM